MLTSEIIIIACCKITPRRRVQPALQSAPLRASSRPAFRARFKVLLRHTRPPNSNARLGARWLKPRSSSKRNTSWTFRSLPASALPSEVRISRRRSPSRRSFRPQAGPGLEALAPAVLVHMVDHPPQQLQAPRVLLERYPRRRRAGPDEEGAPVSRHALFTPFLQLGPWHRSPAPPARSCPPRGSPTAVLARASGHRSSRPRSRSPTSPPRPKNRPPAPRGC